MSEINFLKLQDVEDDSKSPKLRPIVEDEINLDDQSINEASLDNYWQNVEADLASKKQSDFGDSE